MKKFVFIAVLLYAHLVAASPAVNNKVTLKEAINMALRTNSLLKAADYRAKAALSSVDVARSNYYPSITFEEAFKASNSAPETFMMKLDQGQFAQNDFQINNLNHPPEYHDFRTALTLNQSLFNWKLSAISDLAKLGAEREKAGLEATREEVAFLVFCSYLDVKTATSRFVVAKDSVEQANESLRLAKVRNSAGTGLYSDEIRAKSHLASVEQNIITADNDLTLAKMRLANAIGLKSGELVEIADNPFSTVVSLSIEELTATGINNRSDLKQHRIDIEKSDAALKLANASFLPAVGAFASYQLNNKNSPFRSDNDSWSAGVKLSWNLFDGFRNVAERSKAFAEHSAAVGMMEHASEQASYQIQESLLRRTEMLKRLEVTRHNLDDAKESLRLVSKRFENSLATLLDVLDAESALNQARYDLIANETNFALATGRIYYSSGIFLKEILK